jgi:transketolase
MHEGVRAMSEKLMYGSSLKGMRAALGETLVELGHENEKVIVIDAETGTATNIFDFRDTFPERFITVGVAEQSAISFAFGASRNGFIPYVPLFSSFLTRRACDQIFIQMGYGHANVKLVGCYCGFTSPNTGATHQSINDLAIIRSMPNFTVIETADPPELRQALKEAAQIKGPVYIRIIRGDISKYDGTFNKEGYQFKTGKSPVLREGSDITLIACGLMVPRALEAADELMKKGISAEVINLSSIKPIDTDTLVKSLKKTGKAVTAENHSIMGGMGSAVLETICDKCPVPVKMVGILDRYVESAELGDLFEKYNLCTEDIVKAAVDLCR